MHIDMLAQEEEEVLNQPLPSGKDDDDDNNNKYKKEWGDDEFETWILKELIAEAPQLYHGTYNKKYAQVIETAAHSITKWRQRYRGNYPLWNRIFKRDRVVKEVTEAIPILSAVEEWMREHDDHGNDNTKKVTIIDLCSGKGYLSMLLSESLSPDRVQKILLVDKAWPLCHAIPKPHHMSWEHIYGDTTSTDVDSPKYYETWPIPLVTSKQDLKQSLTLKQFQRRFSSENDDVDVDVDGPILILAVHLCGTLSIQAIKLFHMLPAAQALMLKPCCLPPVWYMRKDAEEDCFAIGKYSFPTKEVCAAGTWNSRKKAKQANGSRWKGPPRCHLKNRFYKWCHHLQEGIQVGMDIPQTRLVDIPVQTKGGYQNTFLFAEKDPITSTMWENLPQQKTPVPPEPAGATTTTSTSTAEPETDEPWCSPDH
jgi:hypothetical protein